MKKPYNLYITNRQDGTISVCHYVSAKKRLLFLLPRDEDEIMAALSRFVRDNQRPIVLKGDQNDEVAKMIEEILKNL